MVYRRYSYFPTLGLVPDMGCYPARWCLIQKGRTQFPSIGTYSCYLVSFREQPPHIQQGKILCQRITLWPRVPSKAGTPSRTPTHTSTCSPFSLTPSNSRSGVSTPIQQIRIISSPFFNPDQSTHHSIGTWYPMLSLSRVEIRQSATLRNSRFCH